MNHGFHHGERRRVRRRLCPTHFAKDRVYFGKLQRSREDFYLLTDVFYLQSGVAVDQATSLALTKLGSEAHGPEDQMQINKEHVLFIEDMKDDSKVVQAIQQYISTKK